MKFIVTKTLKWPRASIGFKFVHKKKLIDIFRNGERIYNFKYLST